MSNIIENFKTILVTAHSCNQIKEAIKNYDPEELMNYYNDNDMPQHSGNYELFKLYIKQHKAKDTEHCSWVVNHNDYLCDKLSHSLNKLISTISDTKHTRQLNA
jgi:hypothetical protein